MRIFNSIKWRLQIWYGLILLAVLAGFGFTAFQLERGRQLHRIDEELQRRFAVIANASHPFHPPEQNRPPFDSPPPDQTPDDLPPPQNLRPAQFNLSLRDAALFDANDPDDFYFIVFRDGKEFASSTNAPNQKITIV